MDIRQLETFISVVHHKSFTKAAETLYLTQPSVSNHISSLERELDSVLFIRTRKSVFLTKSGSVFFEHAQNILRNYQEMLDGLNCVRDAMDGHINLYASSVPRKHFVPKLIKSFSDLHPQVTFSLVNEDSEAVLNSLISGETNFGFVGMKLKSSKLEFTDIMKDELVLITSLDAYPQLENYSAFPIEEVLDHKLILREEGSGTRNIFESALSEKSIALSEHQILGYVEDPSTIIEMVRTGIGYSVISIHEARDLVRCGLLKAYHIQDLDLKRSFYFAYSPDMQYVPINRIFKAFVQENYSKLFSDEKTPLE